jgi:hypothetical protein
MVKVELILYDAKIVDAARLLGFWYTFDLYKHDESN